MIEIYKKPVIPPALFREMVLKLRGVVYRKPDVVRVTRLILGEPAEPTPGQGSNSILSIQDVALHVLGLDFRTLRVPMREIHVCVSAIRDVWDEIFDCYRLRAAGQTEGLPADIPGTYRLIAGVLDGVFIAEVCPVGNSRLEESVVGGSAMPTIQYAIVPTLFHVINSVLDCMPGPEVLETTRWFDAVEYRTRNDPRFQVALPELLEILRNQRVKFGIPE